jgi:hypothetical protein
MISAQGREINGGSCALFYPGKVLTICSPNPNFGRKYPRVQQVQYIYTKYIGGATLFAKF